MLKIGVMEMQHAYLFSGLINGVNQGKFEKKAPAWAAEEIEKGGKKGIKIFGDEVRIVKVWDEDFPFIVHREKGDN